MTYRFATLLLVATLGALACDPPPPERVWIPGDDFSATLEVRLGYSANGQWHVGEWITLHADRSTGPWVQIAAESLPHGASWMRQPPPESEFSVESNVRWFVEPGGLARFNVPGAEDLHSRKVQFSQAGVYTMWAESHSWGGGKVKSNVVEIMIVDSQPSPSTRKYENPWPGRSFRRAATRAVRSFRPLNSKR